MSKRTKPKMARAMKRIWVRTVWWNWWPGFGKGPCPPFAGERWWRAAR